MLSVIVPIYNEEKYIAKCVDSIIAQDYGVNDLEVILVDGMSSDRTKEILLPYLERYHFLTLLENRKRTAPCAMNIGIRAAKGDVIMRLDAHTSYPQNYFSVLVRQLSALHADNVGAVCHTDVLNKNVKTMAIREVLSNRFGVGNSAFRTGIDEVKEVDTVPFGCWRREVFEKYGFYDERLKRNQDIELNKRILRGGGHIWIVPDTYSTYYARESYSDLARNNYSNGEWNLKTVYFTRQFSSLSIRHFVPMTFVLSLTVPLLLGLVWYPVSFLAALSFLLYTSLFLGVSISLGSKKGLSVLRLFITFLLLHVSYGVGSVVGLFETGFLMKPLK